MNKPMFFPDDEETLDLADAAAAWDALDDDEKNEADHAAIMRELADAADGAAAIAYLEDEAE